MYGQTTRGWRVDIANSGAPVSFMAAASGHRGCLCRLLVASRLVTLVCNLGEVVATLVKLFSDARSFANPVEEDMDVARFHRELSFTVVSCLLSVTAFVVSTLGARRVLQATLAAAQRLSEHATAVSASRRRSARSQARRSSNAVQPVGGRAAVEVSVVRAETAQ